MVYIQIFGTIGESLVLIACLLGQESGMGKPIPLHMNSGESPKTKLAVAGAGGLLAALLSASAYSTEGVLGKLVLATGAAPTVLLALRFALGAVLLWVVVWVGTRTDRLRAETRRGRTPGLPALPFHVLALIGSAAYTGATLLIFLSLERLPSGLTLTLLYIYPVLVALGSSALGDEPMTRRSLGAALLAFVGVAAVGNPSAPFGPDFLAGVMFALGAAVLNACQLIWTNRMARYHNTLRLTTLYLTYGSILLALVAATLALTGGLGAGAAPQTLAANVGLSFKHPVAMMALTVLPTCVAAVALLAAINRIGAAKASLVATAEPPLALVWGTLFLNERFTPLQLAGAGLVVTAILLLFVRTDAKTPAR